MRVADLIARLQTFAPDLEVRVMDWNEGEAEDSPRAAEQIGMVVQNHATRWLRIGGEGWDATAP